MRLLVAISGADAQHALMEDAASLIDAELLEAYERTTGEQGDPATDTLLAEIERRELDVLTITITDDRAGRSILNTRWSAYPWQQALSPSSSA